jgi:hypothetical protein
LVGVAVNVTGDPEHEGFEPEIILIETLAVVCAKVLFQQVVKSKKLNKKINDLRAQMTFKDFIMNQFKDE